MFNFCDCAFGEVSALFRDFIAPVKKKDWDEKIAAEKEKARANDLADRRENLWKNEQKMHYLSHHIESQLCIFGFKKKSAQKTSHTNKPTENGENG